jgi:transposase
MIRIKDHKTRYMFDPFAYLGPKRRKMIDQSWSGIFRKHILTELPVTQMAKHFPSREGHPTKELYAMMGALLIQQMFDFTDEETARQFAFNLEWHYALDITDNSDASAYVSLKTIWNMREIITKSGIGNLIFDKVTSKLIDEFKVSPNNQRLDSMHITSNMRHLGRIGIFVQTIRKFLVNLKRHHPDLFNQLTPELAGRYLDRKQENAFSMVKPSESSRTLEQLADDLFLLVERFRENKHVSSMTSYHLLARVLREQCLVNPAADNDQPPMTFRANKEITSSSLQNPSDPDAGYDAHKGKGYQVQLAETYSTVAEEDGKRPLALITYAEAEPAHHSDAKALKPMLDQVEKQGQKPELLLADTVYGSDDNCGFADQKNTSLVAPAIGALKGDKNISLDMFAFADNGEVISCPAGHTPRQIHHNTGKERISACFSKDQCEGCAKGSDCPTNHAKKGRYLRYRHKDIRLLRRRAFEQTAEFHEQYRYRSGIEATNSEIARRTGIKKLRIRGLDKVDYCVKLKASGLNILRAAAYRRRKGGQNPGLLLPFSLTSAFVVFKEQFFCRIKQFLSKSMFRSGDVIFQPIFAE